MSSTNRTTNLQPSFQPNRTLIFSYFGLLIQSVTAKLLFSTTKKEQKTKNLLCKTLRICSLTPRPSPNLRHYAHAISGVNHENVFHRSLRSIIDTARSVFISFMNYIFYKNLIFFRPNNWLFYTVYTVYSYYSYSGLFKPHPCFFTFHTQTL